MIVFDKKILLVYSSAPTDPSKTKLYNAIKKICKEVALIFTESDKGVKHRTLHRIMNKIKVPIDYMKINKSIKLWVNANKPDLVFIVKGNVIWPSTLKKIKQSGSKLVSWSNDDMYAWHGRSLYFTLGAKYYDLIVTQKSYNLNANELPSLGTKHILFQNKAYDSALHFPSTTFNPLFSHDVVFIGTYEAERFSFLNFLAENGITINIYGWGKSMKNENSNLIFHQKHLYNEEYRAAITHSKVCLNFLRKKNRDLQTSRSIEIPACKGFMISERSDEHLNLFKENVEAVYFETKEELLKKVIYYLANKRSRQNIAKRGFIRCKKDGYNFENRMKEIMSITFNN